MDWQSHVEREIGRYEDGESRLPDAVDADDRQRQLTRMGNAAGGAGLALLMSGEPEDAGRWFARAAQRYRESFADAPPGSWGRPIGAVKARLLAGDQAGAEADARWTLEAGAAESESPIGLYAAILASLVLGDDHRARFLADTLRNRDDFPRDVADALAYVAAGDRVGYAYAVEDIPVADTVIVLQALARRRDLAAELFSPLLPM